MPEKHNDDCVSVREFDGHVKTANERHGGLILAVEELKQKNDETRSQLKDIKYMLLILIVATAPQLVSFLIKLQTGAH